MKVLRNTIIILILLLLIVIIVSLIIKGNGNMMDDEDKYQDESEIPIEYEIIEVENPTHFYTVSDCVQKYINGISFENKAVLYKILDLEYVEDNGVTVNNIMDYVHKTDNNFTFIPERMLLLQGEIIETYVVEGFVGKQKINLIVKLDVTNMTYAIMPLLDRNYMSIDSVELVPKEEAIAENGSNTYEYNRISDEKQVMKYVQYYQYLVLNDVEKAYNLLDKYYRDNRFRNIEDYRQYIILNERQIRESTIIKYGVEQKDDYKEYVCIDNFENCYIIREKSFLNYTIEIEDYTAETEEFKEEYEKLSEREKVLTNVDKFIKMINNKNYASAYAVLNTKFKQDNFNTQVSFQEYVQNNFFDYNIMEIKSVSSEGNIWLCFVTLKSSIGLAAEMQDKQFVMQLGEGTDFELSFEI